MQSVISNNFVTRLAWFREIVGGQDLVLCNTSALECLGLFVGYRHESKIDVYATERGPYENVNYHVVNNFNGIDFVRRDNLLCTSPAQTFNDMLSRYGTPEEIFVDERALVEGLCKYYLSNGNSFEGLYISPRNIPYFENLKEWAIEFYDED